MQRRLTFIILVMLLLACGSAHNDIIGTWSGPSLVVCTGKSERIDDSVNVFVQASFDVDGGFRERASAGADFPAEELRGKFALDGDRLLLTPDSMNYPMVLRIVQSSDSSLTFEEDLQDWCLRRTTLRRGRDMGP
ncbi:MAG TPA: hypothetical protein VKG92_08710 [Flavobacteriales bacterium]|nr:hypothetical protein [Flavobacteriales bacterium]